MPQAWREDKKNANKVPKDQTDSSTIQTAKRGKICTDHYPLRWLPQQFIDVAKENG